MDEKKAAANGERCFSTRSGVCIAADDSQKSPETPATAAGSGPLEHQPPRSGILMIPMPEPVFPVVPAQPDFPGSSTACSISGESAARSRSCVRRTPAARAADDRGLKPRWSFLDGPITANNPMGVHHAWGRTYKDLFQRFHAMLGQDQRWQNGFDCQGLWVEVNVERELGFKSKRDIETFGIAEFVSLCKQRVLTYAAQQTEQSIRLGMWMDWNDPDELRRLRDLLKENPQQTITVNGPHGPVTDTVEMIVGRLGMPELGGSYFTFSNENNDLIWGFLAEVHRRGWLYKGHDSMPWCTRCGTGMSQMEMNEGYADREDPGLTVRFPLVDRPGEALLVWTTTPWTLTSNVAAAVGPELRYVKVRQGDDLFWLGRGTLKTALRGDFQVRRGEERRRAGRLALRRPVRRPGRGPSAFAKGTDADGQPGYEHRVVPWNEVGEDEGTGIVHIAPGCGAEDFQLGKSLGLPVIAPLDEDGRYVAGFGDLTGLDVQRHRGADHRRTSRRAASSTTWSRTSHRYPHCWRCGTPLVFRVVDEWYISMGPVYDTPRDQLTRSRSTRSLRYQIMDVVDQIRWIPGFGYERELDWLRTMADWMISKKRYWGLALPIWECRSCGSFDVIGGREELSWSITMSTIMIQDLSQARELDRRAMSAVRGGTGISNPWLQGKVRLLATVDAANVNHTSAVAACSRGADIRRLARRPLAFRRQPDSTCTCVHTTRSFFTPAPWQGTRGFPPRPVK